MSHPDQWRLPFAKSFVSLFGCAWAPLDGSIRMSTLLACMDDLLGLRTLPRNCGEQRFGSLDHQLWPELLLNERLRLLTETPPQP